jgi:hypothetical protein
MADTKITALTALTGANSAPGDLLTLVDVSDTTMDAAGSNKSITRQELQTYNAGTLTTDVKVLDLSATWNDAGVTFTGLKFNVTDTASNAASLLLDLQVGGTSKIKSDKTGLFTADAYGMVTGGYFSSYAGLKGQSSNRLGLYTENVSRAAFRTNGLHFAGVAGVGWSSDSTFSQSSYTAPDAWIYRETTGTLAQRHTTNAQTFRIYNTWTDASNYQRLTSTWSTSTALIHNEGAGTGADGSIAFNDAALATDTTKGFIMIPSCAGAPTGTPADIPTGQIPIVFDSTNNKLYVYDGGWISTAALT